MKDYSSNSLRSLDKFNVSYEFNESWHAVKKAAHEAAKSSKKAA